jgi:hypothetical protein
MTLEFHPAAQKELFEALTYYDNINSDLGNRFALAFEQALGRIDQFPEAWQQLSNNSHRCRISNFPYGIVYQIRPEGIWVTAIMHLQRKPDYWIDR